MERTISSRLLHEGRHFSFLRDEVELPNGLKTYRDIVRHPGRSPSSRSSPMGGSSS